MRGAVGGSALPLDLTAAAVAAARRGWAVFPCRPGDKRPAVDRWEERASADPEHVARAWAERWPRANIGIACGPSALVVLDLDADAHGEMPDDWRQHVPGVHDGRGVLAQLAEWAGQPWPHTFTVATPNGGLHCYFAAPQHRVIRNSAGRVGPLVDVRAQGGYAVGPGSLIGRRRYEVASAAPVAALPSWLARLAAPDPGPGRSPTPTLSGAVDARVSGLLSHVAAGTPGDRNGRLYWAARRAGELAAAGRVSGEIIVEQLVSAALAAGLEGGEREARRTVASGMRAGRAE